jgi:hypothetical protein
MMTKILKTAAATRASNEAPWEPPPGMVKRRCPDCRYLFAVPVAVAEATAAPRCADCTAIGRQSLVLHAVGR